MMTLDKFASVLEINAFLGGVGRGKTGKAACTKTEVLSSTRFTQL